MGHDTVLVDDNVGILYVLASCCKPIWGDEIVGYTTRGRGISIHRANCPHLSASAPNPERLVSVGWGKAGKTVFNAELVVNTEDRPGMVGAISTAVQHAGFSLQRFSGSTTDEGGRHLLHGPAGEGPRPAGGAHEPPSASSRACSRWNG